APLQVNGSRGPAKKGEEEEWRREVRAREIEELQRASGVHEPAPRTPRPQPAKDEGSEKTVRFEDEDMPPEIANTPEDVEPVHLSSDAEDDIGDPLSDARGKPITDDDLDPLWAEADLDAVELDSGQAEARHDAGSGSGDEETDLF